jgi:membrane protein implicated in regulation of membrane protease activity
MRGSPLVQNLITIITSNTLFLVLAIIIAIMIALALIRHVFSLFVIAVLVLAAYAGYLAYTGQKIPTTSEEILKHGSEQLQKLKVEEMRKKGGQALKEL